MTGAHRTLGLIVVAALIACGGDSSPAPSGVETVVSVSVSPSSLLLQVGQSFSLTATPLNAAGNVVAGVTATWNSSSLPVATVAPNGVITAVSTGSSVITATVGTHTTTLTVTVIPSVRRVAVSPPSPTVEMGFTLQLTLVLLDHLENQINGTVPVAWTVSNVAKATVSATGVVSPHDTGTVTITGSMSTGGAAPQTGSTTVTIVPHVTTVSVDILPNPVGLIIGQTRTLSAFAHSQSGAVIVGRTFTWTSQGPAVASVAGTTGLVTALLTGAAQISAVNEGVSGSTGVTVFAAAPAVGVGVGFALDQFASIPAGTFSMGSTDANLDERPVRQVTITTAFKIQKTEVTRSQWVNVMGIGSLPAGQTGCDLCPVTDITWDQAQAFITALNVTVPGNNFRLPTEAQWEYAARAGTTGSTPGLLELISEYFITSDNHIWPVALRQPNAFGLYDVIGNASEWTLDWYPNPPAGYDPSQTIDPVGAVTGPRRVDRGGAYSSTAFLARSSYRAGAPSSNQIGFRIVRN